MVECHPSKVDVASSNLVSRSFYSMDQQRCGTCGEIKPVTEFSYRNRATQKRHSTCRSCQKAFKQEFYRRNRESYVRKSAEQKKQAIARNRELVAGYLFEHPCVDCGESDIAVLEFDHLDNKDRSISQLVLDGASWDVISAEIAKCQVRCANCHRKKTARQLNWFSKLGL